MRSCRARLRWWLSSLLHWTVGIKRHTLPRPVGNTTVATLSGRAELDLGAFDAVLYRALPARGPLFRKALARGRRRRWTRIYLHRPAGADRMDCRARRCRHPDAVWIIFQSTLNPIPRGEKRVEALDQIRMAGEQLGDAANDARCVDPAAFQLLATC